MVCRICCKRPVLSGGRTCGNSYCQEADYYENRAKNTRGRMRGEAHALANQKAEIASERSNEEGGVR